MWFDPISYTVDESSGTVDLTVQTNVPGGPSLGEIDFYTVDSTAVCKCGYSHNYSVHKLHTSFTASGDFKEVLGFPVTFMEGSFETTATITINEDTILEENEVFIVKLRHVGVENISIVQDEARVTITDNDGKRFRPELANMLLSILSFLQLVTLVSLHQYTQLVSRIVL